MNIYGMKNWLFYLKQKVDHIKLISYSSMLTVVFHQVSYLIAFYNQSIDYTIHWLLFEYERTSLESDIRNA